MTATNHLGKPTSRIEGHAKVVGAAKYAAEYNVPALAHGFVVSSAIAKGVMLSAMPLAVADLTNSRREICILLHPVVGAIGPLRLRIPRKRCMIPKGSLRA